MIKVIHVDCADWFSHSDKLSVYHLLLSRIFETNVQVVNDMSDADVALIGPYGSKHCSREFRQSKRVWKLYVTGEPTMPDFRLVHHSLSFNPSSFSGRNYRFPIWMYDICWDPNFHSVLSFEDSKFLLSTNSSPFLRSASDVERISKFVAVFNNPELTRMHVFDVLSKHQLCDGIGRPFGTEQRWAGGNYNEKLSALRRYRANMCFENTIQTGYVTEKVFHSKLCGCLTFTWGSLYRQHDFSCIDVLDYESISHLSDNEVCEITRSLINDHHVRPSSRIFEAVPTLDKVEAFLWQSYTAFKEHGDDLLSLSKLLYPGLPEPHFPRSPVVSNLIRIGKGMFRIDS